MATSSKGGIRRDAFVQRLRRDPKDTEDLIMLQGYIGDSDLEGHLRVYSDPALSEFIDLPEKEVLYCDHIEKDEDPLGGARLWVKKTAVFTSGDPKQVNRVKSTFLEGDLMQAFGQFGIPGPIGDVQTLNPGCASVGNTACISNNPPCATTNVGCRTLLQPACTIASARPSCFRTCFTPTCFRTCNQPSCFQTCLNPTCRPSCFRTCFNPSCLIICTLPRTRFCQFQADLGVSPLSTAAADAGSAYAGGFNPYETANYGY